MVLIVFALLVVVFVILPLVGVALWFLITTLVTGLIVGALGRLVVPGMQPIGLLATVCCGWIGSLVGAGIGHAAHLHHLATLLVEIAVAAVTVAVWSRSERQLPARRRGRMLPR